MYTYVLVYSFKFMALKKKFKFQVILSHFGRLGRRALCKGGSDAVCFALGFSLDWACSLYHLRPVSNLIFLLFFVFYLLAQFFTRGFDRGK